MELKNLSVFFPLVNEEENVEKTVEKAVKVLGSLHLEYEIILINDGSTDNTAAVIEKLAKSNSKIKTIHHEKNLGYGAALKSGFYNAKYDVIAYTDGDGQFDISQIQRFIEKLDIADLIIGYRIDRKDPIHRKLFAKGWALAILLFFRLKLKDVDCGFKMIKRKVLDKIPKLESQRGGMINAELAIKAKKYGFRVTQVGVNHYPRVFGKPTGANINVIIRSFIDLFKIWWRFLHKADFFAFLGIVILASIFRFWDIPGYMTFLGDEGRDALIIKRILVEKDIPLIGPPTSVGNMYLGPLYYYMMSVPMAIFWLNPIAAAGQVALIGVATVVLVYYLARVWFGRFAGLIAAFLYAISPVTIIYSKSSWNPNPTPFFALLSIISFYLARSGNFLWLSLTGVALAFAVQMHYMAVLLIPILLVLWLLELRDIFKGKPKKNFFKGTFLGFTFFLFLMSPLLIFDLKHNFMNLRALMEFFTQDKSLGFNVLRLVEDLKTIYVNNLVGRYIAAQNIFLSILAAILILVPLLFALTKKIKKQNSPWQYFAVGFWLLIGLFGVSFYQNNIYDHYLGFLNPVIYILFGTAVMVTAKNKWLVTTALILIVVFAFANLQKNPLLNPPNNQLKRTQEIAKYVIDKSGGKPFNFALLAQNNYDSAYQFYLDQYGHKPLQVPFDITDQLFVVCEDPNCQPINNPKYEIAGFGMSKIENVSEIMGVKVYKLVANPTGKP